MFRLNVMSLLSVLKFCSCARILGIAPMPSYSHQIFYRPIWKELARRGHELTVLTTDPMNDPSLNIREIDWHFSYELRHKKHNTTKVTQQYNYNILKIIEAYRAMLADVTIQELEHPEVQDLLRNESEHFDLVIVEFHLSIMFAFAERFKCPYIGVSSADIHSYFHGLLGNPTHPVLYPSMLMPIINGGNFKERFLSFVYSITTDILFATSQDDEVAKNYFGEIAPLHEILKNVSLVLVNVHPVFNDRALGPRFITIGGGTHLQHFKSLPLNLQTFLDDSPEGVIYFSLGTNVRSGDVTQHFVNVVIETFKELAYKILWKFEVDVPDKSENVKIVKWAPQQDVLRHKNVRLFITQGGLQSMEEGILSEVPFVVIPFVSDQRMNAWRIETRGMGVALNKNNFTKEIFKSAILEVINKKSYQNKVKEIATLLQDEPMNGLEKAIWWIEYVIRHKGAEHLKRSSPELPLYQYFFLDVICVIFILLVIPLVITIKILKYFVRKISLVANRNKQKSD